MNWGSYLYLFSIILLLAYILCLYSNYLYSYSFYLLLNFTVSFVVSVALIVWFWVVFFKFWLQLCLCDHIQHKSIGRWIQTNELLCIPAQCCAVRCLSSRMSSLSIEEKINSVRHDRNKIFFIFPLLKIFFSLFVFSIISFLSLYSYRHF